MGRYSDPDGVRQDFSNDDAILIIGIDFGTTYSSAAWATSQDIEEDHINLGTTWPGAGREEMRVPTQLFYEDDKIHWGYDIPPDADPIPSFKLLLLKEEDLGPEARFSEPLLRARRMLRENGKTVTKVIADYLKKLWDVVIGWIEKSRGKVIINAHQIHLVMTVPAIWKEYARLQMEKAARRAGILVRRAAGETTLIFVPGPEAAALATLCEKGSRFKADDVFVICDAERDTVNLNTYKIETSKPVKLAETVEGTGGLCGGVFIDEAFERLIQNRLGHIWYNLRRAGVNEVMRDQWERGIKPQFQPRAGSDKKRYIVGLPAEAFGGKSLDDETREPIIRQGRIYFKSEHIGETFTGLR